MSAASCNAHVHVHADAAHAVDGGRRRLLGGVAAAGVLGALPIDGFARCFERSGSLSVHFTHGVASGDPLSDRVILWTRVRAQDADDCRDVPVEWKIARDAALTQIVSRGQASARQSNDFCVKVDVVKLEPGTRYWYWFEAAGETSSIGQTKTLPVGDVKQVRFAVFSCANYAAGFFNVYAEAVKRMEETGCYDALLHLGDYIYESAADYPANKDAQALGRLIDPPHETVTLDDYRRRYAQCRADGHLQRLHGLAPMIAVWDDHEFANDAWKDGAANHQEEGEGPFDSRRYAAARAWREWLPVRDGHDHLACYRAFDFGNLVSLNMLDTRVPGRSKPLDVGNYLSRKGFDEARFNEHLRREDRHLLGREQMAWLLARMRMSTATWQMLGQQVLMGRMEVPLALLMEAKVPGSGLSPEAYLTVQAQLNKGIRPTPHELALYGLPSVPYNLDAWDGYPIDRERVLQAARRRHKNLVVLAGDTHNAWASNLHDWTGKRAGVEFATPSVTSPGLEVTLAKGHAGRLTPEESAAMARLFTNLVKPLAYAELARRGYLEITATPGQCQGDWILVDEVKATAYGAVVAKSLHVMPGVGNPGLI
ncbi:hypothetical protein ABE85_24985 [Mitsuaria sp. 7]|nr:hypothetical protein ABE85_24985 [Mitsuaria sp. 7]